jgi:uncharacterized protein
MTTESVSEVIRQFFEANNRAMRGEPVNPLGLCHDQLRWTMTGTTPVARTYTGLKEFVDNIGKALGTQFRTGPGFGLYPQEIIVEGNRAAVLARGHGESAHGHPYNNHYFFFIEIKDGKLFKVLESCDGALVNQSVFDMHLE